MKRLIITEEEKQRILEMHESATKKNYLSEQPVQQNQAQRPQESTGIEINQKKYYLPQIIKDETSLNKFVMWPNTSPSKSLLTMVGLRNAAKEPKVIEGQQNVKGNFKRNEEGMAFFYIQDYLDTIARDKTVNTQSLCKGTFNVDGVRGGAEFKFKERFGDEDLAYLYKYFGGSNVLVGAVKNALKQQLAKFPEVCNV